MGACSVAYTGCLNKCATAPTELAAPQQLPMNSAITRQVWSYAWTRAFDHDSGAAACDDLAATTATSSARSPWRSRVLCVIANGDSSLIVLTEKSGELNMVQQPHRRWHAKSRACLFLLPCLCSTVGANESPIGTAQSGADLDPWQ